MPSPRLERGHGPDADEAVGVSGVEGLAVGRPSQGHAVGLGGTLAKGLLQGVTADKGGGRGLLDEVLGQ